MEENSKWNALKEKYNNKKDESEWIVEEPGEESTNKTPGKQYQNPRVQYVHVYEKQNGCVTFLLVVAAICTIVYTLPKIIAEVSALYFITQLIPK